MYEKIKEILLACGIKESQIDSDDYNKDEIMDSMTIAEVIMEIEEQFRIEIDGEDILPENFKNIQTIIATVNRNGGNIV